MRNYKGTAAASFKISPFDQSVYSSQYRVGSWLTLKSDTFYTVISMYNIKNKTTQTCWASEKDWSLLPEFEAQDMN